MDATTQLALMVKAKKVFESQGTFLSFPVLSPLSYAPEKLRFGGPATDIPTLVEFSQVVNQIPRGTLFQPAEDTYLWDIYRNLLDTGDVAKTDIASTDVSALTEARAILYAASDDGLQADSPRLLAYKQHRDAWISATEEYNAARVTAEVSTDQGVRDEWVSSKEPALRTKVREAEFAWSTRGHRAEINEALQTEQRCVERAPQRVWSEWRDAFDKVLDTYTSSLSGAAFPTVFSPADAMNADWPEFTLTSAEISNLTKAAPSELRSALDLDDARPMASVSFQFRSVVLNRPWLRKEVFSSRFWRLPDTDSALSDGHVPANGTCPAYVTAVLLARRIVEVESGPNGANTRTLKALPMLKLRANVVDPGPMKTGTTGRSVVALGSNTPIAVVQPALRDHRKPLAVVPAVPVLQKPRVAKASPIAGFRVNTGAFTLPRASVAPAFTVPTLPLKPDGSARNVSILAFICRWLPRCPDPDPTLLW